MSTGVERTDVAVIGAGPIGIEVASLLKRNGITYLQFERGPLGRTITRWPRHTRFLSSPERDAISCIPLQTPDEDMVTGDVYLAYLRSVVETLSLEISLYSDVSGIVKREDWFELSVRSRNMTDRVFARHVVLATGNMESPRLIAVTGEDLPHVSHYPSDPHLYFRRRLLIVGGRNSAVETAMRCYRAGSDVTIAYRRGYFDRKKVYSRNHLEVNLLVSKGKIRFLGNTSVVSIAPDFVTFARTGDDCRELPPERMPHWSEPFDEVLICTGYVPDFALFRQAGVDLGPGNNEPAFDPETMETNVRGIFLAGTAAAGDSPRRSFFIGTCHDHAVKILKAVSGITDDRTGTVPGRKYSIEPGDIETD